MQKITAKQAWEQLQRQLLRLERHAQTVADKGNLPDWKRELDIAALRYAIPLVERRMIENAAKHEGGTPPSARQ